MEFPDTSTEVSSMVSLTVEDMSREDAPPEHKQACMKYLGDLLGVFGSDKLGTEYIGLILNEIVKGMSLNDEGMRVAALDALSNGVGVFTGIDSLGEAVGLVIKAIKEEEAFEIRYSGFKCIQSLFSLDCAILKQHTASIVEATRSAWESQNKGLLTVAMALWETVGGKTDALNVMEPALPLIPMLLCIFGRYNGEDEHNDVLDMVHRCLLTFAKSFDIRPYVTAYVKEGYEVIELELLRIDIAKVCVEKLLTDVPDLSDMIQNLTSWKIQAKMGLWSDILSTVEDLSREDGPPGQKQDCMEFLGDLLSVFGSDELGSENIGLIFSEIVKAMSVDDEGMRMAAFDAFSNGVGAFTGIDSLGEAVGLVIKAIKEEEAFEIRYSGFKCIQSLFSVDSAILKQHTASIVEATRSAWESQNMGLLTVAMALWETVGGKTDALDVMEPALPPVPVLLDIVCRYKSGDGEDEHNDVVDSAKRCLVTFAKSFDIGPFVIKFVQEGRGGIEQKLQKIEIAKVCFGVETAASPKSDTYESLTSTLEVLEAQTKMGKRKNDWR